ncbi:MAG: FadR family transcriptional regulator [Anaerolineales bacterium]|nr:FadR family transcriptional regulator [Anaerolineales bacterium]
MAHPGYKSEFFAYLLACAQADDAIERLPSLNELSQELGLSVARLREQLEVSKALGFVEVRPRTGIRRLPYNFTAAVWPSLSYAIASDASTFATFSDLRIHLEKAYWQKAVAALTTEDHQHLQSLIDQAWEKLRGNPPHIPHHEHREFHLAIFHKLGNPFVMGLLEAYWDAYEAVGLSVYTDFGYLEKVWNYHKKMVQAICAGEIEKGFQELSAHFDLLYERPTGA